MLLTEDQIKRQTTICGLVGSYERFKPLKKIVMQVDVVKNTIILSVF